MATLADMLEARTAEAAPELIERISKDRIRCYACGHQCPIPEGAAGVCKVRFVRDGVLHVPWGYVGGVQCDPIEKKPIFHAHPGALAYSVDLKSFDDKHYRQLGGRLEPILFTIRRLHEIGVWLEIVTLLIPGFNDSADEVTRLTSFIASVSPLIPWHVTAFHKDYRMSD